MTNRPSYRLLAAAAAGIILGVGLSISRMIDPGKIQDFLDVAAIPTGGWDPSLAFVMLGGLIVAFFGMRLDRLLASPLAAPAFIPQDRFQIDRPLVIGSAIFGMGWGLAGYCPGPALADLGLVPGSVVLLVLAMLFGSWATGHVMERSTDRSAAARVIASAS
jgi:uncharacterized protein